jgi:REP element-mobilizing transposase RayT
MTRRLKPNQPHRQSIRLKGYDYRSAGAYFVTICTQGRECVLADAVVTGIITAVWQAMPNWFPKITLDEFVVMPNHVHFIVWLGGNGDDIEAEVPGTVTSPAPTDWVDDVGATARIAPDVRVKTSPASTDSIEAIEAGVSPTPNTWIIPIPETTNLKPTLGEVLGTFKSLVFTVYLDWIQVNNPSRRAKFWQRNYYEHIIRNERELRAIRAYIRNNPTQWILDRDNPNNSRRLQFPAKVEDYIADVWELTTDM